MDDGTEIDIVAGDAYEIRRVTTPGSSATRCSTRSNSPARACSRIAPDEEDERTLATILFTDIVDSTATLARLGDRAWRRVLLDHNDTLRGELDRFRGREIATTGDGFLALFDSAARAVRCAAAMTDAVRPLGIEIRAGLHTGEVNIAGGNARGVAVHAAARWRRSPAPARSSSQGRRATCSTGPASNSRTAGRTSSRDWLEPDPSTRSSAPERRRGARRLSRARRVPSGTSPRAVSGSAAR